MTLASFVDSNDYETITDSPAPVGITDLLDIAQGVIRRYCGWHVAPVVTDDVLVVDGSGSYDLMLPTLALNGVTAIEEDGNSLDVSALEWTTKGWLRKSHGRWTSKLRGVKATVTHGFAGDDLKALACSMVARQVNSPGGVVNERALSQAIQYSQVAPGVSGGIVLMQHERDQLDLYRLNRRP